MLFYKISAQTDLSNKVSLLRIVLLGYLKGLASEAGKDGAHGSTTTTEQMSGLQKALPGSTTYLATHPRALLLKLSPEANARIASATELAIHSTQLHPTSQQDLITFILPWLVKASASLEAALLTSPPPPVANGADDITDDATQLTPDRSALRTSIEALMVKAVTTLADNGVRLDWNEHGQRVKGGVGKARQVVDKLISLVQALVPTPHGPPASYPRTLNLFDSAPTAADPFDHQSAAITVRSSLHARALIITLLRVLIKISQSSASLLDYSPAIINLLVATWPNTHSLGPNNKGKHRAEETQQRILAATLNLAGDQLDRLADGFVSHAAGLVGAKVVDELEGRLLAVEGDVELGGEGQVEAGLARCMGSLYKVLARDQTLEGGHHKLKQVFAGLVADEKRADRLGACLRLGDQQPLRIASFFALVAPLTPAVPPSDTDPSGSPATFVYDLLPPTAFSYLRTWAINNSTPPFEYPTELVPLSILVDTSWPRIRAEFEAREEDGPNGTQSHLTRKRKFLEPEPAPTSDVMDVDGAHSQLLSPRKRRKGSWTKLVEQVFASVLPTEGFDTEHEGLEVKLARLIKSLPRLEPDQAVATLNAISLLGCARDSTLSFAPPLAEHSNADLKPQPFCSHCDRWDELDRASPDPHDVSDRSIRQPKRVFNERPLNDLRTVADDMLADDKDDQTRLVFLKATKRLLAHSRSEPVAFDGSHPLVHGTMLQMLAVSRSVRMAAASSLLAFVRVRIDRDSSGQSFVTGLFHVLKQLMEHARPVVNETAVSTLGKLARMSPPQGLIECLCLERLVLGLGHPNIFLRSLCRTQLEQVAAFRGVKTYALVQPHFATIAPLIVNASLKSGVTLKTALECFHQSRDSFFRITKDYVLPSLVYNNEGAMLDSIAQAVRTGTTAVMLTAGPSAAAILAFIYMQETEKKVKAGVTRYLNLISKSSSGTGLQISRILGSVKVPLVFRLAIELGDEDPVISGRAEKALKAVERECQDARGSKEAVDIGVVLKDSIVGILSHMNRGLNESASQRPLRDKQRIVRALAAVTDRVGPGIAGFSPQIMATLQSALEAPGLREVTLQAFKVFIERLKFSEIGPFLGTTTATFVRLWPEFTDPQRRIAVETVNYIVIENGNNLSKFTQDVADLSGIPELEPANLKLGEIRKAWGFDRRSDILLERIKSENDVVTLQALNELGTLLTERTAELQKLTAGDSFDGSVGKLVKTLFAVAVKEGVENEQIRNRAFECLGILGAVDPDRFEMPPAEAAFVVEEDFKNHDEAIKFALHLIQDLLIGAYRSTNDTRHQETLAFAIQELLNFCGFVPEVMAVNDKAAIKAVDPVVLKRWRELPAVVHETCGPLLGGSFSFKSREEAEPVGYPIYSNTSSYRDWIRTFASYLISQLEHEIPKRVFGAFPPVLHLEDTAVAQHLLPHLVLTAVISGSVEVRDKLREEMMTVLRDQVSPTHTRLSENSRSLSAQTVFEMMDHLSRWISAAKKRAADLRTRKKGSKKGKEELYWEQGLQEVEGLLQDIPHILVGQAALTCKAYARSLLNYESHIVGQQLQSKDESVMQTYYDNLHECYANLDEPDGMEGISTKIVSPSVLHQIREHESTGRWTSAQSCWEVLLQQTPEDGRNHIGLLRCLRNLGHYDSMRTHIRGILASPPNQDEWDRILAPFNVQASMFVADWDAIDRVLQIPGVEGAEVAFGRVISAMRHGDEALLEQTFYEARELLGSPIVAAGRESFRRVYDSVVHLHILQELHAVHLTAGTAEKTYAELDQTFNVRLNATSPAFRAREPILNMRRTSLKLTELIDGRREIGELWLETAKIARKAGHQQTAYTAILQARDSEASFAFLESAKLLYNDDQRYKAIQELDNSLQPLLPHYVTLEGHEWKLAGRPVEKQVAKAALRRARWQHDAGRLEEEQIIGQYKLASTLDRDWETPHYHLGHYYDSLCADGDRIRRDDLQKMIETVREFVNTLEFGTKFIYQALPRMLTIWFKLGEHDSAVKANKAQQHRSSSTLGAGTDEFAQAFHKLNKTIGRSTGKLPAYQWLTVLPQMVSRVLHPNDAVFFTLRKILSHVLLSYPHHGFWAMASGANSKAKSRLKRNKVILQDAKNAYAERGGGAVDIPRLVDEGLELTKDLLGLCDYPLKTAEPLNMAKTFPNLYAKTPTTLIIPLQSSLNVSLPGNPQQRATHQPFPDRLPVFQAFQQEITVMTSLQKPRKITVWGDDGKEYSFLCKPKDDLRKDARLMEFNSMIIKLLKKDSDARKRRLNIRTYSVVPLNEECGLIEWVPHVVVLRGILNKSYLSRNIQPWNGNLKKTFDTIRLDPAKTGERFDREVQAQFPPVFHEWFLDTFPEPSAWLRARLAYARTAAVMSMVGFVLGLGDRHCENILLDGTTGDTVHVDFNCLFDRGRTFEVGERVPFRLTANIVDGMGVTGVEGVFRQAAEIALRILRDNKDSLYSVLETFLHDPLVEWEGKKNRRGQADAGEDSSAAVDREARKNLEPIRNKLRGLQVTSDPASVGTREVGVGEQVERLIREARSSKNLGSMYVGWCAWF